MFCFRLRTTIGYVIIIAALFFSCEGNRIKKSSDLYFNFDSLLINQSQRLSRKNVILHKHASINGITEKSTIQRPDSLQWSKELDVFQQLDLINKPINREIYEVKDGIKDPNSNLIIREYKARKELSLRYLKIYHHNNTESIKKIEGLYENENALYNSARLLILEFDNIDNVNLLTSYSITGGQKMIMSDSIEFKIHGVLSYPD